MATFVDLLHEWMMLSQIPRTGFFFLGDVQQSVAEHSYGTSVIAYILAELSNEPINREKVLLMALFHDIAEIRTGDLTPINKRYVSLNEAQISQDLQALPIGPKLMPLLQEYEANETIEAKLVHDADQLELLFILKRAADNGHANAMRWYDHVAQRLTTEVAIRLNTELRETPFDRWWRNL